MRHVDQRGPVRHSAPTSFQGFPGGTFPARERPAQGNSPAGTTRRSAALPAPGFHDNIKRMKQDFNLYVWTETNGGSWQFVQKVAAFSPQQVKGYAKHKLGLTGLLAAHPLDRDPIHQLHLAASAGQPSARPSGAQTSPSRPGALPEPPPDGPESHPKPPLVF